MNYRNVVLLATALSAIPSFGQEAKHAVLAAEKAWSSAVTAGDQKALENVLAPDLTYYHSSGKTDTRDSYVAKLQSGELKYLSIEYDAEPTARVYGSAAVLTGTARFHAFSEGKDNQLHLRFTHVFIRQSGAWRLVAHQSTRLPEGSN